MEYWSGGVLEKDGRYEDFTLLQYSITPTLLLDIPLALKKYFIMKKPYKFEVEFSHAQNLYAVI